MLIPRLHSVLNHQHFPITYSIYRHFSRCRVNCLPRGASLVTSNRSVRRRNILSDDSNKEYIDIRSSPINQVEENIVTAVASLSKSRKPMFSQPPNFKDTRSLDSVDPMILKYTQLLEELDSNTTLPEEKFYFTNFGTIRFDHDNTPKIHGQFDKTEVPDKAAIVDKIMIGFNKDDDECSPSKVDKAHIQQKFGASQENKQTAVERNGLTEKDEKVFEELFGSADDMSDNRHEFIVKSSTTNKAVKLDATDHDQVKEGQSSQSVLGAGYIDEQFFSDKVLQGEPTCNTVKANINAKFNDSIQYVEEYREALANTSTPIQDLVSTKDLNFIDEAYFKSSLELIKENQQPAVEFSKIKGDLDIAFANMTKPSSELTTPEMPKEDILKEKLDIGKEQTPSIAQSYLNQGNEMESPIQFYQQQNKEKKNNLPKDFSKEELHIDLEQTTSSIARSYLGLDDEMESPLQLHQQQNIVKKKTPLKEDLSSKTAYDYVLKRRREIHEGKFGFGKEAKESPTSKSYMKILSLVNERTVYSCTKSEMLTLLKSSIIYDKNDIVGLYKPYGVTMHEGTLNPYHVLEEFLPELASHLNAEKLHVIHRLDAKTTGVLLLARSSSMASTLRELLKEQKIKKTYWTITKGIPAQLQGTVDIPIAEGSIDGKYRMVLRPDVAGFRGPTDKCQRAVTDYRVLSRNVNSAWVEVKPRTGVKHQIRVHLGLGLACPILGDHKYSLLKKLVPQKLPGDILHRLKLKQSEVRKLPIYLHSRCILIPEIIDGRNISIEAKVPAFFNKTLSALKLNTYNNKVRFRGSRCIDD